MADHKFKIGQMVFYRPRGDHVISVPLSRAFRITHQLPDTLNGEAQYQIRCPLTKVEFAASVRELRAV